jgi:GNAT superfamily N-acetyltransferase
MDVKARRANSEDTNWIIHLSGKVQAALTAAGSLQQIGPLALDMVEKAISEKHCYIIETSSERVGCVFIRPIEQAIIPAVETWKLETFPVPHWLLHSFMLEPVEQRKGLGFHALARVVEQIQPSHGTILLDCWAGNDKLRDFYERAGFKFYGIFPEQDFEVAVYFLLLKESHEVEGEARSRPAKEVPSA